MSFETLLPLIKKTGSALSPEDFQRAVNVTFHDIEAGHYDEIHANMWGSLQQQIDLLAADSLDKITPGENLRLLDVGSGTGLSSQLFLNSSLGKYVGHVTLLDTSPKMLEIAEAKMKNLKKPYALVNSEISALDGKYDLILVSSVLHHIPDLTAFLKKVDELQKSGGILLHLQDPNGDSLRDAEYLEKFSSYLKDYKSRHQKKSIIPTQLKSGIKLILGRKTYIDQVNDKLLKDKVIKKRMTAKEIWSVTDIHVENLPYSTGAGIRLGFLSENLDNYNLVSSRSYGFYGFLSSELLPEYQHEEQCLISQRATNGHYLSAIWMKN
ncbi:MAG: class I SAM-dependent methyltransferase [Flavobacterium sp.]|nr:MAG: class I SAM-dependent methyltransferase [Flavobacterium sp.]